MDRQIVYPGSIPLDTDLLLTQRAMMTAFGALAQAVLGTSVVVDGLGCAPTSPPSLSIAVGAGSLFELSPIDPTAFGSLAAITGQSTVKAGINTATTVLTLTPPTTAGTVISYLVQACLDEHDDTPVVLPYYNAANPAQPFIGPGNAGTAQNTQRLQRVGLACKPGVSAASGQQIPPSADPGWTGLFLVNVAYGQGTIATTDIAVVPGAPFLQFKIPQLTPGFSRQVLLGPGTTSWTVPAGTSTVRIQVVGAGGGGGGATDAASGGGGGAGGYAQGIFNVIPGEAIPVTIGMSGAGSGPGNTGGTGGSTSFGNLLSATGGTGGGSANPYSEGGQGGAGSGGSLAQSGGCGTDGSPVMSTWAGAGGSSFFGGGGRGSSGGGPVTTGLAAGSGGGGGYGTTCAGGNGANGLIIVEF